jgi:hypothetical protein
MEKSFQGKVTTRNGRSLILIFTTSLHDFYATAFDCLKRVFPLYHE